MIAQSRFQPLDQLDDASNNQPADLTMPGSSQSALLSDPPANDPAIAGNQVFPPPPPVHKYRQKITSCMNCLGIGHRADVCTAPKRDPEICARCHTKHASDFICTPKCIHCNGPHDSRSTDCPKVAAATAPLRKRVNKPYKPAALNSSPHRYASGKKTQKTQQSQEHFPSPTGEHQTPTPQTHKQAATHPPTQVASVATNATKAHNAPSLHNTSYAPQTHPSVLQELAELRNTQQKYLQIINDQQKTIDELKTIIQLKEQNAARDAQAATNAAGQRPVQTKKKTLRIMPLIIQRNARSLPNKVNDFIYIVNSLEKNPDIICTQEPGKYCHIPGYDGVSSGQCVTYTEKKLPAVHYPLSSDSLSCIQIRTEIEGKTYEIFNCYSPPKSRNTAIPLDKLDAKSPALILGDFNAPCVFWGYSHDSLKGQQLKSALEDADFTLLNTPDQYTRIACTKQKNTSPDLTWVKNLPRGTDWDTWTDNIGSDHLLIVISWGIVSQTNKGSFIDWDKYRSYMDGCPETATLKEFTEHIQAATQKASKTYKQLPQKPAPDKHLLNLWEARISALQAYRTEISTEPFETQTSYETSI
ncbi:hypothetical protein HPB50_019446 [Hyalomma asiaticum]|uniref:Uncharacterized protein n=1 Tax=Hyalomma asiaticum TaxID=266040 RepID=A0ACB7TB07_HYAAI|nr:hypothetical protein HPB50_019446 [Hyalomma asiaticum]